MRCWIVGLELSLFHSEASHWLKRLWLFWFVNSVLLLVLATHHRGYHRPCVSHLVTSSCLAFRPIIEVWVVRLVVFIWKAVFFLVHIVIYASCGCYRLSSALTSFSDRLGATTAFARGPVHNNDGDYPPDVSKGVGKEVEGCLAFYRHSPVSAFIISIGEV